MYERSSDAELAKTLRGHLDRYSPGEKLPSSRVLVEAHRVSPVTVSRALARLAADGLVVTRPGSGVFRAEPRTAPAAHGDTSWQEIALSADASADQVPRSVDAGGVLATLAVPPADAVELSGGYLPAGLRPERALSAALARAGRRPGAWARPPVEGVEELRDWFAREIGGPSGQVTAANVLVTSAGQSAITTALRGLAAPGAAVLVESPTYPGLLAAARASGLRPVPVPVDADGVRPELLAEAFRASGARVFVCQPLFQNPTGAVLAARRREAVLEAAASAGAFVVEDDFARCLAHEDSGPLPPPLRSADPDGRVVHLRSLTKITSPSLRVGALAAHGPVLERLRAVQTVDSFFVSRPLQETALELVGAPAWQRHLRTVAGELRRRREVMCGALAREAPALVPVHVPRGGFHLWVRLPDGTDEAALAGAALRAGVSVAAGHPYFPAESPAPHLRLSFAPASGETDLVEGVRRLRTACEETAGRG